MRRIVALCLAGTLTAGCAVSRIPTFSFGGSDDSSSSAAANLSGSERPAEEKSTLSSLWDNFSAPFRGSSKPVQTAAATAAVKPSAKPEFDQQEALRLVNAYRAQKGLKPLKLEPRLSEAARSLAVDMSRYDRLSHYGPDGADLEHRLSAAGYSYSVAAENIGAGQRSVAEMVESWKKSPAHSRNMLISDARHMGIAMQHRDETRFKTFWTMVVGAPGE